MIQKAVVDGCRSVCEGNVDSFLAMMDTILTGNVWRQVSGRAKAAKRRLIAVAYVSTDRYFKLKKNDVLVCDASDRAIKAGETSARLLRAWHRKGVEVRSCPDLHAKTAVFGRYAIIGSCNLSEASAQDLTELALLTDRNQVVAQATAFIHSLRESSERIDKEFLRKILAIKVHRVQMHRPKPRGRTRRFGNKVWLVSVRELPENPFPKEHVFVEKGEEKANSLIAGKDSAVSWIRWVGKNRFRSAARPGDIVVQIWESLSGKRRTILAPCPIVLRQDIANWTRFYLAESEDSPGISWMRFRREAVKHGLARFTKNSVRELSPRETLAIEHLWK